MQEETTQFCAVYSCKEEGPPPGSISPEDDLLIYCSGGVLEYEIGKNACRLGSGDLLLAPSGRLRRLVELPGGQPPGERTVLVIHPAYREAMSQMNFPADPLARFSGLSGGWVIHLPASQRGYLVGLLARLQQEQSINDPFTTPRMAALLTDLHVELARGLASGSREGTPARRTNSLAAELQEYIDRHYAEQLSLDSLAELFFVSKYHLLHDFRARTGTSVYRYIIRQRLQAACDLLQAGRAPNDVYQQCGFGDYANFYRAFRAEYGISPRACREAAGEKDAENGAG